MIDQVVIAFRSLDITLHDAEQGLEGGCECVGHPTQFLAHTFRSLRTEAETPPLRAISEPSLAFFRAD